MSALGRFLITKKEKDIASFKTPDTRNVLATGPYFHDGMADELRKSRKMCRRNFIARAKGAQRRPKLQ